MAESSTQQRSQNYDPAVHKDTLRNINLDIKEEFIVFVGPSGCGKSTLLPDDRRVWRTSPAVELTIERSLHERRAAGGGATWAWCSSPTPSTRT